MPEYRATRCFNTPEAQTCHFTADNDEAARDMLLSGNHPDWGDKAEIPDCDSIDETLGLDRRNPNGNYEIVDEEIELPSERPYSQPSRQFVLNVAALGEEGAYDDAVEALQRLVDTARTLCADIPPAPQQETCSAKVPHTPTPWVHDGNGLIYGTCAEDQDGAPFVADVSASHVHAALGLVKDTERSNAAFIVTACNAYGGFVDALRQALNALNTTPRFRAGNTNSYAIASRIEAILRSANVNPYGR